MQRMTPAGLQLICRISCSSMRQTPMMRTPLRGSLEWQSEVKTQLLFPQKLSLLPITILFDPTTVFPLPTMMLLYWMSCERTFCSRSTTLTTFWQMEQKTPPTLVMQVTVGDTALQPGKPLMPLKGKKAVLRMEPRKALRGGGRQFKFFCRVYFRSLMATSVSRSKMGSMFRPEKQFCPATMATMSRTIRNLLTALFSIGIEYKQLRSNFDLTAELDKIIEMQNNKLPTAACHIIFANLVTVGAFPFPLSQSSFACGTMRLIQKLNYYNLRRMTTWLGDKYEGEYKQGWYHGYGRLQLDNGVVYEGQFVKGQYHGEGKLIYPNGGYYKAQWVEGKMVSGEYIFNDNLNFEKDNWKHCINDDRRFYQEYLHGIKPSGATQQTREDKPHNIPTGTYDTGDGYYEPVKSIIYSYEGKIFRTPTEEEVKFIIEKCRYVPKAVDIDGSKDKVIKKVLEIEGKK